MPFTSTAVMLRSGTAASEHVQEERRCTCGGESRCTQGLACLVNSGARGGCHMGPQSPPPARYHSGGDYRNAATRPGATTATWTLAPLPSRTRTHTRTQIILQEDCCKCIPLHTPNAQFTSSESLPSQRNTYHASLPLSEYFVFLSCVGWDWLSRFRLKKGRCISFLLTFKPRGSVVLP